MKLLLLNGHGINFKVDGAKLIIKEGQVSDEEPKTHIFRPKNIDLDNIVIYGQDGNISIDAIRWLTKHNVQITLLNWDGKLLTTILPPESVQVQTKFDQYQTYLDMDKRLELAKEIIKAKFARTQETLNYYNSRYPEINTDFSKESKNLEEAQSTLDILMIEGRVAKHYWNEFKKIIPKEYEFEGRHTQNHPRASGDQTNTMLNYGYALLEAECLRAINSTGLDTHIGFLHEKNMGKNSLAYDIQELFRWIIDLSVIELIENNTIKKADFIRTENYNLRLRASGAKKLTEIINKKLRVKNNYKGKKQSYQHIILLKVRELQQNIIGKNKKLDLTTPNTNLTRADTKTIREKILAIKYVDWIKKGFSKGSLFYLKKNASSSSKFLINKEMFERLSNW